MADDLIVSVGANIKNLERQMDAVAQASREAADRIERDFNQINPTASFAVGAIKGAIAAISFDQIIRGLIDANRQIAEFGDAAKRTGLELARVQELRFAAQAQGVTAKQFDAGLDGFAEKLNEARQQENALTRLFEDNNVKLRDRTGEVISTNDALSQAANLIQNAATEFDKIKIAEAVGLTKEWVPLLEGGAEGLRQAGEAARRAGAIIDADMVARAKEFDDAWNAAWAAFSTNARAALGGFVDALGVLIAQTRAAGVAFANAYPVAAEALGVGGTAAQAANAQLGSGPRRDSNIPTAGSDAGLEINLTGRRRTNTASLFKSARGRGGGGQSDEERRTAEVDRYIKTLERQSRILEAERATLGLSNAERAKAIELARIGVVTDESQRLKIQEIVGKNIQLRDAIAATKRQQEELNETTRYFGNVAIDAFDDLILNGAKAEDVAKRLTASLAKAALQAALLGDGPLAGLFGTKSASGGVGGLFGALFGRAAGGPVRSGQPYRVGESGPEVFVPTSPGRIVPAGRSGASSTTIAPVYNVDARGAQIGAAEQIAAALQAYDRDLNRTLPDRIRTSNYRYA